MQEDARAGVGDRAIPRMRELAARAVYEGDPEAWSNHRTALYDGRLSDLAELIAERFIGETRERLDSTFDLVVFTTYSVRIPARQLPVREVKLVCEVGQKVTAMRGAGFFARKAYDRWAKDLNLLEKRVLKTLGQYDVLDVYRDPERRRFSAAEWLEPAAR